MILKRTGNTKTVPIFLLFFLSQVLNAGVPDGFLDVTAEPYFADNTGVMDATFALQTAINDARDNNLVLWLPGGTYTISDRLEVDQPDNNPHFPVVMMGSTVDPENRATLVLAANATGFNDPNDRRAMLHFFNIGTADNESGNTDLYNQAVIGVDFKVLSGNDGAVAIRMQGAEGCTIQDVNIDLTEGGHTGIWGVPGSGGSTHKVSVTGGVMGIDTRRAGTLGGGGSQPTVVITGSTFIHQSGEAIFANSRGAMVLIGCRILRDTPGAGIRLRSHWVGQPFDGSFHFVDSTVEYTAPHEDNTVVVMDGNNSSRSFHFENSYVLHGQHVHTASAPANPSGWRHYHRLAVHELPRARSQNITWQPKETVYIDGAPAGDLLIDSTDEAPPADLQLRHQWHEDFPTWEHPGVVNVKDLGAQGDGVTDDWAVLQAAIDEHEVVFFPKGTYQVSNTLDLRPDSKLIGSFHTFTRIRAISTLSNRFAGTTEAQGDQPIVRTADTADADTIIAFLGIRRLYPLATHNPTPVGNYALEWRCAGSSLLRHVEFEARPNTNVRPDFIARHYYGYNLEENPINPNHPQLDFQTGHWAWPGSEPTIQVRGHGGGRWFNFSVHGRQALRSHVPFIRVEGTQQPINFYHFHIQQQDSINHSEFINASNVSIFGSKAEVKGTFAYFQGCTNVRLIGHGGMSTPDPAVNPPFLFRFIHSDNFIIAGIGDTVNEGATQWVGGPFDRWVHTHIRDWNPILDQHPARAEVQVPWDTRPIVYVRGTPDVGHPGGVDIGSSRILTPSDYATRMLGEMISFQGEAFDSGGADVSELGIWSSSLQGEIGTGSDLQVDDLVVGLHVILYTVSPPGEPTLQAAIQLSVESTLPEVNTVILTAEADTYVRGGDSANLNFGTNTTLRSRGVEGSETYYRFDLSEIPGTITSATLQLALSNSDSNELEIRALLFDDWDEMTVTYETRPAIGEVLTLLNTSGSKDDVQAVDVSAYVAERHTGGAVSFATTTSSSALVRMYSRETASEDLRPQLVVTYATAPPPEAQTLEIIAEADTFVRGDEPNADTNYGANTVLRTRASELTHSLYRFDLSGVSGTVISATLRLTLTASDSGTLDINAVSDTAWDEMAVTYTTRPDIGSTIATLTASGVSGTMMETDVTAYVAQHLATGKVSFGTSGTGKLIRTASRESANEAVQPQLFIVYVAEDVPNTPPSVTITAPEDNSIVPQGSLVTFTGSATDAEDADSTLLASATWTSSLDGALGTGGSVSTSSLSVGIHTITFAVTDSGGLSDSAQITLTVEAVPLPTYTVTFLAGEGGSLTGSTSQDVMEGGSTTDVTALANEGYAFVSWTWTGDGSSTDNPLSIANVTQNLAVTAHFEKVVPPPPSTAIFDQDFSTSAVLADYIGTADHRFDFLGTVGNAQDRASLSVVDGRMRNTIAYTDDGTTDQLSAARLTRLTDLPFEENFGVVSSRVILAPDAWDKTNVVYYGFHIGQNYRSGIYNPGTGTGRPHFATLSIQGLDTANTFRTIGAGGNSSNFTVTPENGRYVIDVVVAANAGISSQSFPSPTGDHTVLAGHVSIWINGSLHINNTTTGVTATETIKHISFSTGSGTETDYAGGVKWNGYYEIDYVRAQTLSNFTGFGEDAYTEWAATNNIIGSATDLTDGVPNLLRYALGGDASTPASAFRLEPVANTSGMTLSFPRIDDPKLTYEIWATDNLMDWGLTPYWSGQGAGVGEVQVPAIGSQLYLHLRVRRE